MTVTSIEESWSGDDGSTQAATDGTGSSSASRKFTVTVNNLPTADSSLTVLGHPSVPKVNSSHPTHLYFRCEGVDATRVSPILFEVVASYSTETADPEDNPLNEPPDITFSSTSVDGPVDEDIDGDPIQTINGEPIHGVTMPFADMEANITKNILTFNPVSIYVYTNAVNSTTFMGFPPGVVRCSKVSAKQVITEQLSYWTVSVTVQFRKPVNTTDEKSWWKRVRHEGLKVKVVDPDSGLDTYPPVLDENGKEITKPVMIKLSDGTAETDKDVGHWIEFEVHRQQDLNGMGLGV